jgi:hypothetical protein
MFIINKLNSGIILKTPIDLITRMTVDNLLSNRRVSSGKRNILWFTMGGDIGGNSKSRQNGDRNKYV